MLVRVLTLASLAMLGTNIAQATTYFDTISAPATASGLADGPGDGTSLLAASFYAPGTPDFSSVTLALNADAPADNGSVLIYLVPDDGTGDVSLAGFPQNSPTGFDSAFLLGTISDSALAATGTGRTLVTLAISAAAVSSVTLSTSNGEYWIGLAPDGSSSVEWSLASDSNGIGLNGQSSYNFDNIDGGTVFAATTGGYQMIVSGENVPEPATLAILGGGLAGIGYVRRRGAKQA